MYIKNYKILGTEVILQSESERFLSAFDLDYSFFSTANVSREQALSFFFYENRGGNPFLSINGAFCPLDGYADPLIRAYQIITQRLMREIKGFSIVHAGVAARGSLALIVSGPSGSGKSTLIKALLGSGFHFLSDDFCPIHEGTRQVHPFPRTMWFVKSGEDINEPEKGPAFRPLLHRKKVPLRLEHLKTQVATKPYVIKSLLCLDPGFKEDRQETIRVVLKKEGEGPFFEALSGLEGALWERLDKEHPIWLIRYPKDRHLTVQMNRLLAALAPHLLEVYKVGLEAPDFSKKPSLTPLSRQAAVHCLMAELKEFPVKPGACFMKLNGLLEGVSCFLLSTGKLAQMKELALKTMEGNLS